MSEATEEFPSALKLFSSSLCDISSYFISANFQSVKVSISCASNSDIIIAPEFLVNKVSSFKNALVFNNNIDPYHGNVLVNPET